jgi:hypothetical protein
VLSVEAFNFTAAARFSLAACCHAFAAARPITVRERKNYCLLFVDDTLNPYGQRESDPGKRSMDHYSSLYHDVH